jgi:hypothetical protein
MYFVINMHESLEEWSMAVIVSTAMPCRVTGSSITVHFVRVVLHNERHLNGIVISICCSVK